MRQGFAAALTICMVFHLPLRQTEGFLRCLTELLEIDLPIPDHTTLSRRLKSLRVIGFRRLPTNRPIHLLIDSTGLRAHVGHMQKPPRNRAWRKMHLAVDAASGEIVASDLTTRRTHDCTQVPALLEQEERNRNIRLIRKLGRREWYTSSGYSKPSMVENTMYRYKTVMGRRMGSRTFDGQLVEVQLASKILNTMTCLGMPDSYRVA